MSTAHDTVTTTGRRLPGPDVVRAVAMAGVVMMNYHGYLVIAGARRDGGAVYDLFDPWTGPLSTRFAATFVLTAGVGVTLMTRNSVGDPDAVSTQRWRLVRRGLVLYAFGLLFDMVWPGSILPFYGVMFALAAPMFTWRIRWLLLTAAVAAAAGAGIRWWRYEATVDGANTDWLTDPGPGSPRGLVFDVFVNGTHPLLPWLAFFCVGIVVGRLLGTSWWRPAIIGAGFVSYSTATLVNSVASDDRSLLVLGLDPFDRSLPYTMSALGTALCAFGIVTWLADRFDRSRAVEVLRRAGQMSLSVYIGHALVFNLVVDGLGLVEPAGITTAVVFAAVYWSAASALAVTYQRRYGRGPAEQVYRALTT